MIAGGQLNPATFGKLPGHGSITPTPDFSLFLGPNTRGQALNISVQGTCDTVLLVSEGRSGPWHFSDDVGNNPNPAIRISNARDGLYAIWVGTFGSTDCDAQMILKVN